MSYQINLYINRTGKDWTERADFLRYYNRTAPYPTGYKSTEAWRQAYLDWKEKNSVLEVYNAWSIYQWTFKNLASLKGQFHPDTYFGEITEAEYNKLMNTCETALETGEVPQEMRYKLMEEAEPFLWQHIRQTAEELAAWKSRIDWTKDKVYFYSHP